jgi:uncharacterized membrane protein
MTYAWIAGYLIMDIVYVSISRDYYLKNIAKVSGSSPKQVLKVALCALGAYLLMAIGWSKIVVPVVRKKQLLHAAKTGALYGLVLYGVFNCTTGAMFDKWGFEVMLRDTAWGTLSIAMYTTLYTAML